MTHRLKEAVYSANISEKKQHQNELILDANPVKEYGNQPSKSPKDQVMIYYRYMNKPQRYIHKKPNIKSTLLYICGLAKQSIRRILERNSTAYSILRQFIRQTFTNGVATIIPRLQNFLLNAFCIFVPGSYFGKK